jgi:hypothetical protein
MRAGGNWSVAPLGMALGIGLSWGLVEG